MCICVYVLVGFSGDLVVKKLPASAGDTGSIPGLGISSGEGNRTHSSILAWEIPWTEEPGGLQCSLGESQRVRYDRALYRYVGTSLFPPECHFI